MSPRILVVYDEASVTPSRVARAARAIGCDIAFAAMDTPFTRTVLPVLTRLGPVVEVTEPVEPETLNALRALRPSAIVTFSQMQLAATATLAASLNLPYHEMSTVDAVMRKDAQRARLAAAGVDDVRRYRITRACQVDEAISRVGLPAVVKPDVGVASRNTFPVTTLAHCRAAAACLLESTAGSVESALVIEELLVGRPTAAPWGDYIAVDCVAVDGDVTPLFVTSKFALAPPFRERGGYGGPSAVERSLIARAERLGCQAVQAVGVRRGIADVELKLTPQGPRVIEVNGRLGGWVDDLARRAGVADPVDTAIKVALGRDPEPPRPEGHGRVAFNYLVSPPASAGRVRAVRNVPALRRLRNVDSVQVRARPGVPLDWRWGSNAVATVLGMTDDVEELARTIAAIEGLDWIDYE